MNILVSSFVLCSAKEKALLEIVMHKITKNGEYKTEVEKLIGNFSSAGSTVSAEGDILQIHPMGICSQDVAEPLVYGWVGVMRLEHIQAHCMSLYKQAEVAIRRGATAVVFDVTDVPEAVLRLQRYSTKRLHRPVIIIGGQDAARLVRIIQTQENAWARIRKFHVINTAEDESNKEFLEVGIFVAVFVIVCVFGIVVVILKCRNRDQRLSMAELTKQAIAKLETRKYQCKKEKGITRVTSPTSDVYSQASSVECCAICLEEYTEGEVLRVLPCSHEFHPRCVDKWLVDKRTCPFCLYNIIEPQHTPVNSYTDQRTHDQRQFYQLPPNDNFYPQIPHSSYMHYYHTELHNGCTSCEGTVGSSDTSSRCQRFHCTHEPIHQRYYPPIPSCCAKNITTEIGHVYPCSSFITSGITYSHHVTSSSYHQHYCPDHRQINNAAYRCYYGNGTRLYQYTAKKDAIRTCESEPEYTSGKDISIKAQFGSCSSDSCSEHVPSNSSLNCPECVHQFDNVADSNISTCGSCENQECSDNSSYDSNVFWGGAPDQMCTDVSSEKTSISGISFMENIGQNNGCQKDSKFCNTDKFGNKSEHFESSSSLNLSEISGSVRTFGTCSHCSFNSSNSSLDKSLNLSRVSGLTDTHSSTSQLSDDIFNGNHSNCDCRHASKCNELSTNDCKYSGNTCVLVSDLPKVHCSSDHANSILDVKDTCVQATCQCDRRHNSRGENLKEKNHTCDNNHNNTQGQTFCSVGKTELCVSPKTVIRETTGNLLHNFRLSRSCELLASSRRAPSYHGEQIISRQPQLIAKDSIVTATSQGTTVTVHLNDDSLKTNGNVV